MKPVLLLLGLSLAIQARAQVAVIPVPDSLLKGADQVVLEDHTHYSVLSRNKATLERTYTVLLINPAAIEENALNLPYDSFSKIKKASVAVQDLLGRDLQTWALKDFEDWKAGGTEIASDSRVKSLDIPAFSLPFYLQVTYEREYNGSLFYPVWSPVSAEKQGLAEATFVMSNATPDPVRYLGFRLGEPEVSTDGEATEYRWSVSNLSGFESEPYSGGLADYAPVLYTAPSAFEMDGFEGDMQTWASFGDWIRALNSGQDDFTRIQQDAFKAMFGGLPTDREKVRAVYAYLQKNMRYVSIQLGIGGWRPFPASFVHDKKYGDCKALTFYTKSILDVLEIPSFYTLVRAGAQAQSFIREEFPCASFNHVFLTVPLEGDTIWLECTSQDSPFGYLGTFTSDRNVLLVDEHGGHLIRSRVYTLDENRQVTRAQLVVREEGTTALLMDRTYSGLEIENDGFFSLFEATTQERENWLYDRLEAGIGQIADFQLKPVRGEEVPETGFTLDAQVSRFAKAASNRIFVQWNTLLSVQAPKLPDIRRQAPLVFRYPYRMIDSLEIAVPEGFIPESIPDPVLLDTPFGKYQLDIQIQDGGTFLLTRQLDRYKGEFPASDYPAFREFIQTIRKSDQKKIVWKKG
ncbi:MAG: DUF3857 domain-containing protein [Lewinellaceae bacterium]|nr:DUF3857 domain-containing protein [Lewinellaceae bacterium]